MKKILLPICAMLLCMTACKKDEGVLKLEIERYNTNAKVHIDIDHYAVWDNNDKIWLNGAEATVNISGSTGTIVIPESASYYNAIYPFDRVVIDPLLGTIIKYPETQYYRRSNDNGKQIVDAPMAAVSEGGTLRFQNLGSLLALTVSAYDGNAVTVEKIVVTDEYENSLCGDFQLLRNGANMLLDACGSESNTVTLDCSDNPVEIQNGIGTFYIAMPPTENNTKLTIRIYANNENYYYERTQGGVGENASFAQNMINEAIFIINESVRRDEGGDVPVPASNQIWVKVNNEGNPMHWDDYNFQNGHMSWEPNEEGYYVYESMEPSITEINNMSNEWNWLLNNDRITSIILPASIRSMDDISFESDISLTDMAIYSSNVNPDHNIRFGFNTSGTLHLVPTWRPEEDVRMDWRNTGWQGEIVFDLPSSGSPEGPEGPMP